MSILIQENEHNGIAYFYMYLEYHGGYAISDKKIAETLGLSTEEYFNMGLKHNGYMQEVDQINESGIYFNKREDIKAFIAELDPYLVMLELAR